MVHTTPRRAITQARALHNPKKTIISEKSASTAGTTNEEPSGESKSTTTEPPAPDLLGLELTVATEVPAAGEHTGEGKDEDQFLTTIFDNMEPYLDTYSVYTQLLAADFTPAQADEILNLLIVQLNSKLLKLSTKYSQNYELENERYLYESAQQELRVDITRSREHHINELINSINILERDFHTISDELSNLVIQMKNDTQVAMSDQKSENTLLLKKIILRIQETNHKITTELNLAMRSEIESLRWHYSRWGVMAILVSLFSVFVSYYIWRARMAKRQVHKDEFVPLIIYEPSEFDEDDYHTDLDRSVIS